MPKQNPFKNSKIGGQNTGTPARNNTRPSTSSHSTRQSTSYISSSREIKWFPCLYFCLMTASFALILCLPLWVVLLINIVEILLSFALFNHNSSLSNYGDEYHTGFLVFLAIIAVGLLIISTVRIDDLLPNLKKLSEMVDNNQASLEFYKLERRELVFSSIVSIIVAVVGIIIGIIMGENNIGSAIVPSAVITGEILYLFIINAIIEIPTSNTQVYHPSSFIETIIGSALIMIPALIYALIFLKIGNKAGDVD